jgi:hypothetical protein
MVIVSVNPGRASPRGTARPTIASESVVVVADGRVVVEAVTVSPVKAVLDVTTDSSSSDSVGDGDLSSQP